MELLVPGSAPHTAARSFDADGFEADLFDTSWEHRSDESQPRAAGGRRK
jgi:hypothetical protein